MAGGIIYMATNTITGFRYVGMTSRSLTQRKNGHLSKAMRKCDFANRWESCWRFHGAIRSYGPASFEWRIIEKCATNEELVEAELAIIAELRPEYNLSVGGKGITLKNTARLKRGNPKRDRVYFALRAIRSRPVICLTDGKAYESGRAAALAYGIAPSRVMQLCQGGSGKVGSRSLCFMYADESRPRLPKKRSRAAIEAELAAKAAARERAWKTNSRRVKCLLDGKIYDSSRKAALAYGLGASSVWNAITFSEGWVRNRRFAFAD